MEEHVGEESPHFVATCRVEDEGRVQRYPTHRPDRNPIRWHLDGVTNENADLKCSDSSVLVMFSCVFNVSVWPGRGWLMGWRGWEVCTNNGWYIHPLHISFLPPSTRDFRSQPSPSVSLPSLPVLPSWSKPNTFTCLKSTGNSPSNICPMTSLTHWYFPEGSAMHTDPRITVCHGDSFCPFNTQPFAVQLPCK